MKKIFRNVDKFLLFGLIIFSVIIGIYIGIKWSNYENTESQSKEIIGSIQGNDTIIFFTKYPNGTIESTVYKNSTMLDYFNCIESDKDLCHMVILR